MDGSDGRLPVLTVMRNPAINIQAPVGTKVFLGLGYRTASAVAESRTQSLSAGSLEELQPAFHGGRTTSHSLQQHLRVAITPHPHQHLLLCDSSHPRWVRCGFSLWFWLAFPW